ncbi:MAG: pentapeptide repeat-containing protein [Gammaproteobacteria bacterium]|nr:pentapeptide repeat-containing protein [Gammaproteobacteria bacterium]
MRCFIFTMVLMLSWAVQVVAEEACEGDCCAAPYNGRQVSAAQLEEIAKRHAAWLMQTKKRKSEGKPPDYTDKQRANLCGAILRNSMLRKLDLSKADLRHADLQDADLVKTQLREAWLDKANLYSADLFEADLSKAYLYGANLSFSALEKANLAEARLHYADMRFAKLHAANLHKAELEYARLSHADLNHAILSNASLFRASLNNALLHYTDLTAASLHEADLTLADLTETVLKDSLLHYADLSQAIYFPEFGSHPNIGGFATAKHIETMTYYDKNGKIGAPGLMSLRAAYKEAGMRPMERLLTYMIKTKEQQNKWENGGVWTKFESGLSLLFFDWSCAYGLVPERLLYILLVSIMGFTLIYWLGMGYKGAKISKVCFSNPPGRDDYDKEVIQRQSESSWGKRLKEEMRIVWFAFYFSLLSAFYLGWRDFNIGVWISKLQIYEYDLMAEDNWFRSVSGIQALLSIYLFALWAMTEFGRPFQ